MQRTKYIFIIVGLCMLQLYSVVSVSLKSPIGVLTLNDVVGRSASTQDNSVFCLNPDQFNPSASFQNSFSDTQESCGTDSFSFSTDSLDFQGLFGVCKMYDFYIKDPTSLEGSIALTAFNLGESCCTDGKHFCYDILENPTDNGFDYFCESKLQQDAEIPNEDDDIANCKDYVDKVTVSSGSNLFENVPGADPIYVWDLYNAMPASELESYCAENQEGFDEVAAVCCEEKKSICGTNLISAAPTDLSPSTGTVITITIFMMICSSLVF